MRHARQELIFRPKTAFFTRALFVTVLFSVCFGQIQPARAQIRSELLLALPLFYGTMDQIADEDVATYQQAAGFIGIINALAGRRIVYPKPQMTDTPIGAAAWLLNRNVDGAFLPYPVYAAVEATGSESALIPLATVPSADAVIIGNRAACEYELPFPQSIAHSRFLGNNEYAATGRLLAEFIFSSYGQKPRVAAYSEVPSKAIVAFNEQAEAEEPTMFLTDVREGRKVLGTIDGTCALLDDIVVPWPSVVFAAHSGVSQELLDLLRDSILKMSKDRTVYFPASSEESVTFQSILEQVREFSPPGPELELQLNQARSVVRVYHLDPRGFFNLTEFVLRLRSWAQKSKVAIILPPSNSRAAYPLGSAARVFLEIEKYRELSDNVFLIGNSGGAIGTLVLALAPKIGMYEEKTLDAILDPEDIVRPAIRYKILIKLVEWWLFIVLGIWLLLRAIFYGEVLFWTVVPAGRNRRYITISAFALSTLALFILPPLTIEQALPLFAVLSLALIVILLLWKRLHLGVWGYAITAVTFVVFLLAVRGTFFRPALMDRLDLETPMRKLSAATEALRPCTAHAPKEDFSRCLFEHLRYPIVITTSDLVRSSQIVFYANAGDSKGRLTVPRKRSWVNLADCPEQLITVAEASASFPFVFPPVPLTCAGKSYLLTDGAVFAAGTSAIAGELEAETAVTFLDTPFVPKALLGIAWRDVPIRTPLEFLQAIGESTLGESVNFGFQETLPKLRHVIFTPSATLVPTYYFFGVTKDGITYTQPAVFRSGFLDASKLDGHFLQISGGGFQLDIFSDLLEKRQPPE